MQIQDLILRTEAKQHIAGRSGIVVARMSMGFTASQTPIGIPLTFGVVELETETQRRHSRQITTIDQLTAGKIAERPIGWAKQRAAHQSRKMGFVP
jgi:hypothetical protein